MQAKLANRAAVMERVGVVAAGIEANPLAKAVQLVSGLATSVAAMLRGAPPSSTFQVDVAAHLVRPTDVKADVVAQLGATLDVRVTGTGPRLAFFHHGFGGKHECYTWAVEALAEKGDYTVVDYQRTDPTSLGNNRLTQAVAWLPGWLFAPLQDPDGLLAKFLKLLSADECAGKIVAVLNDLMLCRTDEEIVEKAIKAELAAFPLLLEKLRADGRLGAAAAAGTKGGGGGIIMAGHSRGGGVAARFFAQAKDLGLDVAGAFLLDPIDASLVKLGECTGVACTGLRAMTPPPRDRVAVVGAQVTSLFNPKRRNYACFLGARQGAQEATPDQERDALLPASLHSTFMDFDADSTNSAFDLVCNSPELLQKGVPLLPREAAAQNVRTRYGMWETQLGGLDLVGAGDE
jgi:pimeloyl-ACP methyl ester carboxylesterase